MNRRSYLSAMLALSLPSVGYAAGLEELTVTASRREASARDVPISMEVRAGDEIYRDRLQSLEEISTRVPNLIIGDGVTNTNVSIRGIGSGNDRSLEQAVGLFVDGIYMPRSRQYRVPFLDVERVEVLRGPQASLFGINSTAGAIEVLTRRTRPGDASFGELGAEYEAEYGGTALTAIAGGSVGDTIGLRGAFRHMDSGDGYYDNRFTGQDENGTQHTLARLSMVWEPVSNVSIDLSYEYADFETDGHIGELIGPGDAAVDGDGTLNWSRSMDGSLLPLFPGGGVAAGIESTAHNARLSLDYQIAGHNLTLLTAYVNTDWDLYTDLDATPAVVADAGIREKYDQTSLEFRVASPVNGAVDYIVGVFFNAATLENDQPSLIDGTVFLADAGFPFAGFENSREWASGSFQQDTTTWSLFGSATWHITDSFRLIGGARYNDEEKDYARQGECLALRDDGSLEVPDLDNNQNDFYLFTFVDFCPTLNGERRSRTSQNLMPELTMQWNTSDTLMFYGRLAASAKSGGFAASTIVAEEFLEYDDEDAQSIEFGLKAGFADGAAELNLAVFRTDIDDLQVNSFDADTAAAVLTNAAEARSQGVELQGRWAVSGWLNFGASLAWLDAEYKKFPQGPCAPSVSDDAFCNLSGMDLPYAPENSATVFGAINYSVANSLAIDGRLTVSYTGDYFTDGSLDPVGIQEAYTLIDARIGLGDRNGRWNVGLVGKNLTDEAVLNFNQPFLGSYKGHSQAPRTVAIQAGFRFGG